MQVPQEMQTGTPLLLRTVDERNQERLQICTCKVDPKGQVLKLIEQDGLGNVLEVRINTIAEVLEESATNADAGEEEPGTIRLMLKGPKGALPTSMELICASHEDFLVWRDGLRSVVGAARSAGSPQAGAKATADSKRARTVGVSTGAGAEAASFSPEGINQLMQRLRLQEELITELRQENGVLNEMVKQKDLVIQQLSRDLQSRGTKAESCNKTESTSRESDDHLRDRQTAILKRKNLRLKKLVEKKQQTIASLMQTLQSALGNQASDADMLRTEDDADEVDSDAPAAARAAARAGGQGGSDSESEPEAIREEMKQLTGKLARLERDVEELNMPEGFAGSPNGGPAAAAAMLAALQAAPNASRFQPPPRGGTLHAASPAATLSPQAQQKAAQRAALAAAAKAGAPSRGMGDFDFSAVGGAPSMGGMSKGSKAALEALANETKLLEEKKRTVERLAKQLEPPSDNEDEDDGFPLQ